MSESSLAGISALMRLIRTGLEQGMPNYLLRALSPCDPPAQIPASIEIYEFLMILSNCC